MILNRNKFFLKLEIINNILKLEKKKELKIFLKKSGEKLFIIYENLELRLYMKVKIKEKNKLNIKITVPFIETYNIIKNLKSKLIILKLKKNFLTILNYEKLTSFSIKIDHNFNLSKIKFFKNKKNLFINKDSLNNIIKYNFFILKSENLNICKGIYIKIRNKLLIIFSTDNFKLSYFRTELKKNCNIKKNIIINIKTFYLLKMISKNEKFDKIKININNNLIEIKIKNIKILSNLIIDEFPKIKKSYIESKTDKFEIKRDVLVSILNRSNTLLKNNFNNYINFVSKGGNLKIITKGKEQKLIDEIIINNKFYFNIKININFIKIFINNVKFNIYEFFFDKKNKILIINLKNFDNYKYIITILRN